jgi:replicative DNA helicase
MTEQAEVAVLGALFADDSCISEVVDKLRPEDFLTEQNRLVYSAIVYKDSIGDPVNPVTVGEYLKSRRKLTAAGGASYLAELTCELPDVVNIRHYAELVKEAAIAYQLRGIGRHLVEHDGDSRAEMGWALQRLMDLSGDSVVGEPEALGDIVAEVMREAARINSGEAVEEGIRTMYPQLDATLLYMKPQDLLILAARPSVGKSALATNMAMNIVKQNIGVLFISLEMSKAQLGRRMISVESGIPYSHIMSPKLLTKAKMEELSIAEERMRTWPLVIDDRSNQTLGEVRTKARRQKAKDRLGLVIVDYVQLLCSDPDSKEQITAVSSGLKSLEKDLKIPVLGISQLSRYVEHRDSNRVQLSDLRGSGQLEQDADCVIAMYRRGGNQERVIVDIIKHRNGPLGVMGFHLDPKTTKFEEELQEV